MVRQCPETDGCLDLYHPPCPTRQFLVYIHSQLVPTSPPKLGIKLSSPKQRCMLLPKVQNCWWLWQWPVARQHHISIKMPWDFAHFMLVVSVALVCGPPISTCKHQNLDQANKWFPSLEHLECLKTGRKLQKLLVCTVPDQGVSQPSPKHQHETPCCK